MNVRVILPRLMLAFALVAGNQRQALHEMLRVTR